MVGSEQGLQAASMGVSSCRAFLGDSTEQVRFGITFVERLGQHPRATVALGRAEIHVYQDWGSNVARPWATIHCGGLLATNPACSVQHGPQPYQHDFRHNAATPVLQAKVWGQNGLPWAGIWSAFAGSYAP